MANQERHHEETSNFSKGLLIGMLTGGAVGAAIALLYAPKSGRELRSDISEMTNVYVDKAGDVLNSATERAQQIVNEGRRKADHIIDDARNRASSLLTDAERIVTDARAKAGASGEKIAADVKKNAGKLSDATKAGVDAFKEEMNS